MPSSQTMTVPAPARLPGEAGEALLAEAHDVPRPWDSGEFVERLAHVFGTSEPEATADAVAVLGAVGDAVGDEGTEVLLGALPAGFTVFFSRPGRGRHG
ncbi:DUF2267 domain-containing protein [Streptomyces sp. NPDC046261]|uniref:DUF2267 domain-containing protein n=1 Tax=Streptomyces sp. NPDC046261 TaxID=3157200 RepID=UPI0033D85518